MGVAHYTFGGTAHEDVFQARVTVSGDDDQVAIEFLCGTTISFQGGPTLTKTRPLSLDPKNWGTIDSGRGRGTQAAFLRASVTERHSL